MTHDFNLEGYVGEADFFLPGAFESYVFLANLVSEFRHFPEHLKKNVRIAKVYGSPNCIWNGGRYNGKSFISIGEIHRIANFYNSCGAAVRLIFTNRCLDSDDYRDNYCNKVVKACMEEGPAEAVVYDRGLESYLRDRYPDLKIVSSITRSIKDSADSIRELQGDYLNVCINEVFNKDLGYLDSVPLELRDKVEILVNSVCTDTCPLKEKHWDLSSELQLGIRPESEDVQPKGCPVRSINGLGAFHDRSGYLYCQELNGLIEKGYHNFKLEGRSAHDIKGYMRYFMYIVNPDFYYDVFTVRDWDVLSKS